MQSYELITYHIQYLCVGVGRASDYRAGDCEFALAMRHNSSLSSVELQPGIQVS